MNEMKGYAKSFLRFRFNGFEVSHAELVRTYVTNIAAQLYGNFKGKVHPKTGHKGPEVE
jgi:hypothetical protein